MTIIAGTRLGRDEVRSLLGAAVVMVFRRRRLAGGRTPRAGIVVYSLESQQYEKLMDFGSQPVWLSDSRRLLFPNQGKLYLVDSQSKKIHEVLSAAPHDISWGVALSRDDRQIYFSLLTIETDIWLMTMV